MPHLNPAIRLPLLDAPDATRDRTAAPAEPRDAASVILLRDGAQRGRGTVEAHLMLRHSRMPFAPRAVVFPGGGVDPRDDDPIADWSGPDLRTWAKILAVDASTARRVLAAAARETFEETGVLFAECDGRLVSDTSSQEWETDRRRLVDKELSFGQFLRERSLTFRSDLLHAWSRWTTPDFEPRRYRTWFFTAEVPPGQTTRDVSGETISVEWVAVRHALERADRGETAMFPPQVCLCLELFEFTTSAQVLAAVRDVEEVTPSVSIDDDGSYLAIPSHLVELSRRVASELALGELRSPRPIPCSSKATARAWESSSISANENVRPKVEILPDLPKTVTGKILRRELR